MLLHLLSVYFWQSYLDKFPESFLVHAALGIFFEEIFTLGPHSCWIYSTGEGNLTDNVICEDDLPALVAHDIFQLMTDLF